MFNCIYTAPLAAGFSETMHDARQGKRAKAEGAERRGAISNFRNGEE
jgi:hypothetical protein